MSDHTTADAIRPEGLPTPERERRARMIAREEGFADLWEALEETLSEGMGGGACCAPDCDALAEGPIEPDAEGYTCPECSRASVASLPRMMGVI